MDDSIERLYQQIGQAALGMAGDDLLGRLLVYAEAQDGAVSADVVYESRQTGAVALRLGSADLKRLVYDLKA